MNKRRWIVVLLILVLVAIGVDIMITLRLLAREAEKPFLSCSAVPTDFILENPDCADKLAKSMNFTNVHVVGTYRGKSTRNIELNLTEDG